jgi:hypothetical protein
MILKFKNSNRKERGEIMNKIEFLEKYLGDNSNGLLDCFLEKVVKDAEKEKEKYPLQYEVLKKFYDNPEIKCFINGLEDGPETVAIIDEGNIYFLKIHAKYSDGGEVFYKFFIFDDVSTDEKFEEAFSHFKRN